MVTIDRFGGGEVAVRRVTCVGSVVGLRASRGIDERCGTIVGISTVRLADERVLGLRESPCLREDPPSSVCDGCPWRRHRDPSAPGLGRGELGAQLVESDPELWLLFGDLLQIF